MDRLKNHFRQRPVTGFVLLTFAISYLIGIPGNILLSSLFSQGEGILSIYAPILLIGTAPAISAIIITSLLHGKVGVKAIFISLLPNTKTWFYLILTPLVSFILMGLSLCILGVDTNTLVELLGNSWVYLLLHLAAQYILVGVGEEIGWRGWLFPQLLKKHNIIKSISIAAIIWTVWHLPKLIFYPATAPFMILMFIGVSVLLAWVWLKSKANIGLIAMIHAAINTPFFFVEQQGMAYQISADIINHAWSIWSVTFFLVGAALVAIHYTKWFKTSTAVQMT